MRTICHMYHKCKVYFPYVFAYVLSSCPHLRHEQTFGILVRCMRLIVDKKWGYAEILWNVYGWETLHMWSVPEVLHRYEKSEGTSVVSQLTIATKPVRRVKLIVHQWRSDSFRQNVTPKIIGWIVYTFMYLLSCLTYPTPTHDYQLDPISYQKLPSK